ncbi:hypothetical protein [Caulobacter sp. S45]|uniref:hypothetical protein n=1 Tax=Caulobacter sp. S45 TaxID=1641861 RepID=UPI001575B8CF|nr:hypothetical protein [Caulobacter sp. S45]
MHQRIFSSPAEREMGAARSEVEGANRGRPVYLSRGRDTRSFTARSAPRHLPGFAAEDR